MGVDWEDVQKELTPAERLKMKETALDRISSAKCMMLITKPEGQDPKKPSRLECLWMAPVTKQEVAMLIGDVAEILDAIAERLLPDEFEEAKRRVYTPTEPCDCPVCKTARGYTPKKWYQFWRRK